MMQTTYFIGFLLSSFVFRVHGQNGGVQVNHGLVGYGINMNVPGCAWACQAVLQGSELNCSTPMDMGNMVMGSMVMSMTYTTSASCYATNDQYLQSLALCLSNYCKDIPVWQLEQFWATSAVGTAYAQPDPKESYQSALEQVRDVNVTLTYGDFLNQTSIVADSDWVLYLRTLTTFSWVEIQHEKFGIILVVSGFILPVTLSFLRVIPFPATLTTFVNAHFIYPPLWGKRHATPLPLDAGIVPTRGQSLFIAYLVIINVVLSAAGYRSVQPNAWYANRSSELAAYIANRLGVLSFANIPLLMLYSSRNNLLLWLTDWSRTTFLLLHRWIAYICILEAILHSAVYLRVYITQGTYTLEAAQPFWYWGIIATLALVLILPLSILAVRRRYYEFFHLSHITLALLTLIGCYLHIWYNFFHQWGYETWIYVAFSVFGFDRIVRILKVARNGIRTARISIIDEDYIRLDIAGVAATGHAYLYFPTLTWRFWENHPFSITSSVHHVSEKTVESESMERSSDENTAQGVEPDLEKYVATKTLVMDDAKYSSASVAKGLTFFLRPQNGLTPLLRGMTSLPVLVETSYGHRASLDSYPTLICIAGGVGITALLPSLHAHEGRTKLFWSLKSEALATSLDSRLKNIESVVSIGKRLDVKACLEAEILALSGDVLIMVCGPAGMVDVARNVVVGSSRKRKGKTIFVEESFSW